MDGINSRLKSNRISEMEVRIGKITQNTAHREKRLPSIEKKIICQFRILHWLNYHSK